MRRMFSERRSAVSLSIIDSTLDLDGVTLVPVWGKDYMAQLRGLHELNLKILDLLKAHPAGLNIHEIRAKLKNVPGIQQHLDRRVRQLRKYFHVPLQTGNKYVYKGEKKRGARDSGAINATLRATVYHAAHGRCQMCGLTIAEDGIKLQVDHKIPQTWDGPTAIDNLWALCQLCNGGKRNYFRSFNPKTMKKLAKMRSVYERIGSMLRMQKGKPVPSWLLQFVANIDDFQEDWQKRLRELRYPVIGWKIRATRSKTPSGKWQAAYELESWKPLPANHQFLIKEHERRTKRKRQALT
jgi:5-methylcytosine-specific restriction endonuclease McrA